MSERRIDAHQHFWHLSRGDYRWLTPELAPLYRDFGPEDLAPLLRAHGIAGCIAVQAAESTAETAHLLGLARAHPWIEGVVGWVDVHSPNAIAQAQALRGCGPLVGLRPMLQDREPGWILEPSARAFLMWLEASGLCFEALVRPAQLSAIGDLMARHPGLRTVIDHAAKPDMRAGAGWRGLAEWEQGVSALARRGVCVKLSGLLTEARVGATAADVRAVVDVLLCAGSYARWADVTDELLAPLAEDDRVRVLGGAAARFYNLPDTQESPP